MADRHLALHAERGACARGSAPSRRRPSRPARAGGCRPAGRTSAPARRPASRWPLGSRSMAQGSRPPTTSAPIASALVQQLDACRDAPACRIAGRRRSRGRSGRDSASRVSITPSMPARPTSVSTSTWLRIWVVPCCDRQHDLARRLPRRVDAERLLRARSLSILSISRGPACCLCQPMPHSVLSRWVCASTSPASAMAPPPSIVCRPVGAGADRRDAPVDDVDGGERPGHRADIGSSEVVRHRLALSAASG